MSNRRYDADTKRLEKLASEIHVAQLVKVVRFDPEAMTVDVQPLLQAKMESAYTNQPQLLAVPVVCLCMGGVAIRPWYAPGDLGLVVISDGDIDAALGGSIAAPYTERRHDLSDAIFIGGIAKQGATSAGLPSGALALMAGSTVMTISPDGVRISGRLYVNGTEVVP